MKPKQILLSMLSIIVLIALGYMGLKSLSYPLNERSSLLIQNVEALTNNNEPSKLDCSYTPVPQSCSASISAEAAAKLFGLKVGSISGNVEIPIVGAQECRGNGDMTCRPVRCDELINALK